MRFTSAHGRFLPVLFGFLALIVQPAAASSTTTALAITAAGIAVTSVTSGTAVTLTATVLAGSTPVTPGIVNFCDATAAHCTDIHILATAQLTSGGTATARFTPGNGSHSYKAVFLGTKTNAASTSGASSLSVVGAAPSTAFISKSGGGANYTLTATVGGTGTAAPAGTVSFRNAGSPILGTGTLGAGALGLSFLPARRTSTMQFPYGVAVADFNGDGKSDIVFTSNEKNSSLNVLLGEGQGTFTGVTGPSIGFSRQIVSADFNGDGNADLAVLQLDGNSATVLLGNGAGTFMTFPFVSVVGLPNALATGDFNGDGNVDLAFALEDGVKILFGNGDGTFTAAANAAPSIPGDSLAVGDFNGDGIADIVLSDDDDAPSGNTVTVLLGNGDGTFSVAPATGVGPAGPIVTADFNGDGKLDLAVTDPNGNDVIVLLGNGDGTFAASDSPSTGANPQTVLVADFNGDGIADLAVGSGNGGAVTVLPGKGDGTFSSSLTLGDAPFSMASGDFNQDGVSDLVLPNLDAGTINVFLAATRSATASVSGISVPTTTGVEMVDALYAGSTSYAESESGIIRLNALTSSLSPSRLSFLPTYTGDSSAYQTLTYANTGTGPLDISSITVNSSVFQVRENTCGLTLAAGASCTFAMVFKPNTCCAFRGDVEVVDSHSDPDVVLTGTGKSAVVDLSTCCLAFAPTAVGTTAAYQTVVVTNSGNEPLSITSIAITNTSDFYSWGIREQTCGSTLAAGGSCTFSIAFRPTHTGPITAEVTVDDHVGTWQQKITLAGAGK